MYPTGNGVDPVDDGMEGGVPIGGVSGTSPGGGDGRAAGISGDIATDSVGLVEDARGVEDTGVPATAPGFGAGVGIAGEGATESVRTVGL